MKFKMGTRHTPGFTIIETMLFLAVSGAMIAGLFVGIGASLNNQRYRDAVETFKNTLQQQYADLGSIQNGRDNSWSCSAGSDVRPVQGGGSTGEVRGQSDCVLVGSYLRIVKGTIYTYSVLAVPNVSQPTQPDDVTAMKNNYTYNVSDPNVVGEPMEWGTAIAWPASGGGAKSGDRSIGLLFIRSPASGLVYTFSSDSVPPDGASITSKTLTDMMVAASAVPGRGERTLCIQSSGLSLGADMAVTIDQYAATTSAVEVRSNDWMKANLGDNPPQC